ncbi:hypothetical protein CERSUDRAFT_116841 [Gelatoporia subvermispora B]|uniref:Potassium channel domain-containing protein n=1 Tax=Ceriporiopsis subvermispora (strain B) TaxID=914234 RepID=M2R7J7_CERS8|nr:hypothetical protein CERSUDRAFT_116841 [Gelatoporia subvermispora B]
MTSTTFSVPLRHYSTFSSGFYSTRTSRWLSKIRSYIFAQDDPDHFVPNYRWTPIVSGVVIPFAILLEIPGLTERWYIRTEGNTTVETRPNPVILDVGMAVSMACALIANICLVLRFLEKRVRIVTILCIAFLTVHDLINISAVTIFGVEHRFDDGFTYGQSFWITLCSTVASTFTNITLVYDFVRTPNFAESGSGLTRRQRGLVIIVIVLLAYIAFGALVNSLLLNLSFIDGLYFTTVTIETIGFGDLHPDNTASRVWICFYAVVGIINIGVVIAMCRETVLEGLEMGYRKRIRALRQRRREARRFRRWETRWRRAVEWRLRERRQPVWVSDSEDARSHDGVRFVGLPGGTAGAGEEGRFWRFVRGIRWRGHAPGGPVEDRPSRRVRGHPFGKRLNLNALSNVELEEAALEAGVPLELFLDPGPHRQQDALSVARGAPHATPTSGGRAVVDVHNVGAMLGLHGTFANDPWPPEPATPTHAQLGRMAAVLTKVALTHSGRHAHMPGHPSEDAEQRGVPEHGQPQSTQAGEGKEKEEGGHQQAHAHGHGRHLAMERYAHVPKWLREFKRGAQQTSRISYEELEETMRAEEKKAHYAKLIIAYGLFFVFWIVGSAIFSATESWSYGIAMYFCFVAFTTLGYGDYSPQTPAGRSIFVVWALFGVGTLTILVSVLQEAGSSRYKSALHSHVFDRAVRKFRQKEAREAEQVLQGHPLRQDSGDKREHPGVLQKNGGANGHPNGHATPRQPEPASQQAATERIRSVQDTARRELEALPTEIIRQARAFHDSIQYFIGAGTDEDTGDPVLTSQEGTINVPEELRKLLDEIATTENIGDRVKKEILQDDDARKTLFMLNIERALRNMIRSAERALAALADRDALIALDGQRQTSTSRVTLARFAETDHHSRSRSRSSKRTVRSHSWSRSRRRNSSPTDSMRAPSPPRPYYRNADSSSISLARQSVHEEPQAGSSSLPRSNSQWGHFKLQ